MAEQRTLDAERAACEAAWASKSSEINAKHRVSWNAPMPEPYRIWFGEGYRAALTAPPALDAEGLPELPPGDDAGRFAPTEIVYLPGQVRQAMSDAVAADRRARRPIVRTTLSPEMKAALEEAFKTRSTAALLPGGSPVFINYGDQPEDTAHLSCTACGGSGHIDDQQQLARTSAPEGAPVGMVLVPVDLPPAVVDAIAKASYDLDDTARTLVKEEWACALGMLKLHCAAPTSASAQPADQNKMEKNDE